MKRILRWLASKGIKTWKDVLFKLSPTLVAVLLITATLALDDAILLPFLGFVWSGVAVVSVTCAVLLWRKTKIAVEKARRDFVEDDPRRELAESNHLTTSQLVLVHSLFLFAGVATLFLSQGSIVRITLTREVIMEGQYILMLKAIAAYLTHQKVRKMVYLDENGKGS